MFGLDEWIARGSDGTTLLIVVAVAALLGLRHATDPDHLAAVTTLIATGDDRSGQRAAVGVMIVALAVWLLVRRRRGTFHPHAHTHVDEHRGGGHGHGHPPGRRTSLGAYAIGLVHGMGGSAGVGLVLLAEIQRRVVAMTALAVLALFTAVSMWIVSAGWGLALSRPSVRRSPDRVTPALGLASLAFGVWYALGALTLVPNWEI